MMMTLFLKSLGGCVLFVLKQGVPLKCINCHPRESEKCPRVWGDGVLGLTRILNYAADRDSFIVKYDFPIEILQMGVEWNGY